MPLSHLKGENDWLAGWQRELLRACERRPLGITGRHAADDLLPDVCLNRRFTCAEAMAVPDIDNNGLGGLNTSERMQPCMFLLFCAARPYDCAFNDMPSMSFPKMKLTEDSGLLHRHVLKTLPGNHRE